MSTYYHVCLGCGHEFVSWHLIPNGRFDVTCCPNCRVTVLKGKFKLEFKEDKEETE